METVKKSQLNILGDLNSIEKQDKKMEELKDDINLFFEGRKANKLLNWKSKLSFKETAEFTASWYLNYFYKKKDLKIFTLNQISTYFKK